MAWRILLVGGEKTPRSSADILETAQKCMPAAQRVTIPNAAHGMHRQNADAFDAALLKFSGQASASRRSLFGRQDDLDAPILGAAFRRHVFSHRLELAKGGSGEVERATLIARPAESSQLVG